MATRISSPPLPGSGLSPEAADGTKGGSVSGCGPLVAESVDFFVSFAQVFGFPKSIGQIYGLLFVSADPLAMDDIVSRLGISKGSASQGLALLRSLGAVTPRSIPDDRREHFQADLNVSRIVTHFFENRLQPRFEHGEQRLAAMLELARANASDEEGEAVATVLNRIEALEKWQRRGRSVVPMIIRWLRP